MATFSPPRRRTGKFVKAKFFQGEEPKLDDKDKYRSAFAAWLTAPENKFFANATVNRLWARFFARGLVNRVRGRRDRRVVEVGITEKGREILRSLDEHVDRMPKAMLGHLGARKLEQLNGLLDDLMAERGRFP